MSVNCNQKLKIAKFGLDLKIGLMENIPGIFQEQYPYQVMLIEIRKFYMIMQKIILLFIGIDILEYKIDTDIKQFYLKYKKIINS